VTFLVDPAQQDKPAIRLVPSPVDRAVGRARGEYDIIPFAQPIVLGDTAKIETVPQMQRRFHAGNGWNAMTFFQTQQKKMGAAAGAKQQIGPIDRGKSRKRPAPSRQKKKQGAQKQHQRLFALYANGEALHLNHGLHGLEYPFRLFLMAGPAVQ
jgi:hypothetical protein